MRATVTRYLGQYDEGIVAPVSSQGLSPMSSSTAHDPEASVRQRYSGAAQKTEPALCCPILYDQQYLTAIPQEVLERDYGCGDPTPFVRSGDTVLDLGSGGGKVCFIAAQVAGPAGRVIG